VEDISGLNKKFQKEILSGVTALVLLSVMEQGKEPMYGYQIAKLLDTGEEDTPVKQGALYPVLRSLENSSLLESKVEPSISGPPRRYYRITALGSQTLESWIKIWEEIKVFVDNTLRGDRYEN
jgi:PadR family transcriptional regulator PadR